jgi:hypothetical protein
LTSGLLAVGPDAGAPPLVKAFDPVTHNLEFQFLAAPASFRGGVRVAVADVNNDGTPDVIAATGPGGGNRVEVVDGKTGLPLAGPLGGFQAFTSAESNGVFVAAADVDGDGRADIVVGSEAGGAGLVRVYSGRDGHLLRSLNLGADARQAGVRVAAGDVQGDGHADLITGSGPGVQARIGVFDGITTKEIYNFFAFDQSFRGGVNLAAGDVNGDGKADIIVGAASGAALVRTFSGSDTATLAVGQLFDSSFTGGVRVGVADANGDGHLDIVAGQGPGGGAVTLVDGRQLTALGALAPYGSSFAQGLFVAGASPIHGPADPTPTVTISANTTAVRENAGVAGVFTLTRDITSGPLSVNVQMSGTAIPQGVSGGNGPDYDLPGNNTVNFAPGQATATLTFHTLEDNLFDSTETVVATIVPFYPYNVGNPSNATIAILEDIPPPATPESACGCGGSTELIAQAPGHNASFPEFSPEGVRYFDGLVRTTAVDLSSGGFGDN